METLAKEFADQVHFLFIYGREAHPGELIPHHTTYSQKLSQAQMLRDRGMTRTMLIDHLAGTVHRAYGGVANMSWIIDHTGRVAYKASWTDADDIRATLKEVLTLRERRQQGGMAVEFYREVLGLRLTAREMPGHLGGKKAEEDFRKGRESILQAKPA